MKKAQQISLRLFVGSVLYQVVWFATVLSAGQTQRWWWGVLAVVAFMGIVHTGWPALRQRVWTMFAAAMLCGLVVDTGMILGQIWRSPRVLMKAPLPALWLLML